MSVMFIRRGSSPILPKIYGASWDGTSTTPKFYNKLEKHSSDAGMSIRIANEPLDGSVSVSNDDVSARLMKL